MRDRLRPIKPVDAKRLDSLLQGLGSDRFVDRERAIKELESLEETAEPALRRFLAQDPPLEARRRADGLLARILVPITRPERLQRLRAVEALEYIGSADARDFLTSLAQGAADAELTHEAKAASERLAKRPPMR